jgi:hypothetical protein
MDGSSAQDDASLLTGQHDRLVPKAWLPLLLLMPAAEAVLLLFSVRLERWANGDVNTEMPEPVVQSAERSIDAATSSAESRAAMNGPATSAPEARAAATSA